MSEHHRTKEWAAVTRKARPRIKAALPLPCVDCGRPVHPGDTWHVGHIVAYAIGGTDDAWNLGPSHAHCNTKAGAQLREALRKRKTDTRELDW